MYGPKIDMTELWPERTCGTQDTLNIMYNTCGPSIRQDQRPTICKKGVKYIADYVKEYIS